MSPMFRVTFSWSLPAALFCPLSAAWRLGSGCEPPTHSVPGCGLQARKPYVGQRSTFLAFSTAKKFALCDMASFLNSVELYEKPKLKFYHKRFEKKNGGVSQFTDLTFSLMSSRYEPILISLLEPNYLNNFI